MSQLDPDKRMLITRKLEGIGYGATASEAISTTNCLPPYQRITQLRSEFSDLVGRIEKQELEHMGKHVLQGLIQTAINLGYTHGSHSLLWRMPQERSAKPSPVPPQYEVVLERKDLESEFLVTVLKLRDYSQPVEDGLAGYEVIGRCCSRADVALFNERILAVVGDSPYSMKHEATGEQLVYRMMGSGVPRFLGSFVSPIEKFRQQEFDVSMLVEAFDVSLPERDIVSQYAIGELFRSQLTWLDLSQLELQHASYDGLFAIAQLKAGSSNQRNEVAVFHERINEWTKSARNLGHLEGSMTL